MLEHRLQSIFGFDSFKKGQKEVVGKIMDHQSAAAIFPTGAGKSMCYQLPAMLLPHLTLVVSPLLSLMKDQLDFLTANNIPAARLDSTLSREEYNNVIENAKNGKLKILMISVERFKNERFRFHLRKMNISLLVIDEAHCISEWGHNFRPEYLKLPMYREEFNIGQVLLLTATATEQVVGDMCRKFNLPSDNVVATGFYRSNLFLQITPTAETRKNEYLLKRLNETPDAPTIIYVTLQKTAETVAAFLQKQRLNALAYHAGMDSEKREDVQNRFMNGEVQCIVATIAFGMGIDKKDIRCIIHYDLPKSIENYSQEIGRAGRDGKPALCEVLGNLDNLNVLENFTYGDTPQKQAIYNLLDIIRRQPTPLWEIKANSLSNELDIKLLPLKTLLVYLDMEGLIQPKFTRFDEYTLKYRIDPQQIINMFQGERKAFVTEIFANCYTKKVWTQVDVPKIMETCHSQRQRIIAALEYFDQKEWIELQSRQTIDVYDIKNRQFDIDPVTEKIYGLFVDKESFEIRRTHQMVDFFQSDVCISKRLAEYFGEHLEKIMCGHCSVCRQGPAVLERSETLKPLSEINIDPMKKEFAAAAGNHFSVTHFTRFLCGISSPIFTKFKIRKLPHFGILERYPFADVKNRILENQS